jgi:hypothetical protein
MCIHNPHRRKMAYNIWTERVVVRMGTGQCGFGRAPLAVVEQTNMLPAESSRCPSDKLTRRASSSDRRERDLLDRWLRGSFRTENGSKQLGREFRLVAFARLATGAAGPGLRICALSDVLPNLLRLRVFDGKGRVARWYVKPFFWQFQYPCRASRYVLGS